MLSTPFGVLLGIALIILSVGVSKTLKQWAAQRSAAPPAAEALVARMDEVEARLRDVLDVMIALSEKMDRWERDEPAGRPTMTSARQE